MTAQNPYVIEIKEATFDADVLERSQAVPVVLDFWAEWCGPCRVLGPVLEKLAGEYQGKFVLAKANTELVPRLAAEFGVRSIPAVFAVRDGEVVDSFLGALPESAIRSWLDRLLPTPAEMAIAEARVVEAKSPEAAEAKYRQALELAPDLAPAKVGLARLLARRGQTEEAGALLEELERRGFLEPEAESLKAELALRGQAGGVVEAEAALAAQPGDPVLAHRLAEALAAAKRYEEALELCLRLVEEGPKDVRDEARKTMLNVFQVLPADAELAADYRRRLASALF